MMTADPATDQVRPIDAGFAHLEAEAAALEGGPPIPGSADAAQHESAQLAQTSAELEQALQMARLMVAPMFRWWPEFGDTWSDRTLKGISMGGAAVMVKHGWNMGDLFSAYGPYIALAGATLPPAIVTYGAIKEQKRLMATPVRTRQGDARTYESGTAQPPEGAPNGSDGQAPH